MSARSALTDAAKAAPRTLSRRTLMAVGAAAGMLQFAPSPLLTRAAQDGEETFFNLVIVTAAPNMLDPAENWEGSGGFGILAQVYDGLFRFQGVDTAEI
ncbi:MAG: hypothetical protein M3Z20_03655, partial [Chloroflexota bacterium]|nr:hypothetical protein [Chloroflexota bacterium]